jgi:hypothetical protein
MFNPTVPLLRDGTLGNGILSVYVVNQLAVPDDTVDNDIEVNVFMSVHDNFEVAAPTSAIVGRLRVGDELNPHSEEANASESTNTTRALAMNSDITDGSTLVYFGESIPSFRQLLRRYNFSHIIPDFVAVDRVLTVTQPAFPLYPGYRTGSAVAGRVIGLAGGAYVYGQMTLLQYISCAYAARRGGIRYFIDASTFEKSGSTLYVSRIENRVGYNSTVVAGPAGVAANPGGQALAINKYLGRGGLDGAQIQSMDINPTMSVEIPYYNSNKFEFAKEKTSATSSSPSQTWFTTIVSGGDGNGTHRMEYWVSTGEDFGLFFYLGPPIFYYEALAPSS